MKKISEVNIKLICELRQQGALLKDIASRLDCSPCRIWQILIKETGSGKNPMGKPHPTKGKLWFDGKYVVPSSIPAFLFDQIRELYAAGLTKQEIRERLGCSYRVLEYYLPKMGLLVRSRSEEYSLSYHKRRPSSLTTVTKWEIGFIEGLYVYGFNGVQIQNFLLELWGRRLDVYSILHDDNFCLDSPAVAGKKRFSRLLRTGARTFRHYTSQTKPEKELMTILNSTVPGEYKYTGRGEVWIGERNPDFFNVNGQKKVIELFGNYWHKAEDLDEKIKHYKKYGYDCLVIWENELNNREEVVEKIACFSDKEK